MNKVLQLREEREDITSTIMLGNLLNYHKEK